MNGAMAAMLILHFLRCRACRGGIWCARGPGHWPVDEKLTRLPRRCTAMQVSDILTGDVETLPPSATVKEAAQRMRSADIGSLPVCDGRRLLGMVTDRDITIRITAEGRDAATTPVMEA